MSITSFTTTHCPVDPVHAEKITELISEMISRDLMPLSFVEGEGFCKLMDFVEPEPAEQQGHCLFHDNTSNIILANKDVE